MKLMIKLILQFFAIMPLRLNHSIGSMIGHYLNFSNSESKKVVSKNITTCFPKLDRIEQQNLIKNCLIETGKGLSEMGFVWLRSFSNNAKHVTKTIGAELLHTDQPTILLVPHFGCWEMVARMSSLQRPSVFLYKKLANQEQNKLLLASREQGDLTMASADKKGVIKIQRAINNKQLIGILPDQDPGEEGGVLSPFFNTNARTMTLLVRLARKNNAKVVLSWAYRLPNGQGYELNYKSVDVLSESGDIANDVQMMNQEIESLVETHPEQYLWNYKRFKSVINYSS